MSQIGWQRPVGEGPIISIILGSDELAMDYQKKLEAQGLLTVAIRPPTVPEGKSRLRLVIRRNTPYRPSKDLSKFLKQMKEIIAMHGWAGDSHQWSNWKRYLKVVIGNGKLLNADIKIKSHTPNGITTQIKSNLKELLYVTLLVHI